MRLRRMFNIMCDDLSVLVQIVPRSIRTSVYAFDK